MTGAFKAGARRWRAAGASAAQLGGPGPTSCNSLLTHPAPGTVRSSLDGPSTSSGLDDWWEQKGQKKNLRSRKKNGGEYFQTGKRKKWSTNEPREAETEGRGSLRNGIGG